MVIFSFNEIFDIMIMSFVIGFVFKDFFKKQMVHTNYDPLAQFNNKSTFFDESFKTALIIIAPAIIFHEFGHKFVAMFFGLSATFHAAYGWLAIALLLKLSGFGFVFLVPAYVSFAGATYYQALWIAFAGPAVNLIFYLISHICIKKKLVKSAKKVRILLFMRKVNGFLFIFNMLPIPGFDGYHVFNALVTLLF